MSLNREKLAQVVKPRSEAAISRAIARKKQREWLRMSHDIALCLHYYMRTSHINQKQLAEKIGVSAAYMGKLLKGGENLTLETICKLQNCLDMTLVVVAKPFVSTSEIIRKAEIKFSDNAVVSEKFSTATSEKNSYIIAAGDAA